LETKIAQVIDFVRYWTGFSFEKVLGIGAEAILLGGYMCGQEVVVKYRLKKNYRDENLDRILRYERTVLEAKLLCKATIIGVNVPSLMLVYPEEGILISSFIRGERLKEYVEKASPNLLRDVFKNVGRQVGLLHNAGIIHGDLTTSNIILSEGKTPFLIDFGLGFFSNRDEDAGVDLHLFARAIESTHPSLLDEVLNSFIEGYRGERGEEKALCVIRKMKEIRMRGRYVRERKRAIPSSRASPLLA
jgi:TP53 regulating kinase-like protein